MKFIILIFLVLPLNVFACWKVQGTLGIDGETHQIHQKFDHGKEYIFAMGTFILKLTIEKGKEKKHKVKYAINEKKGTKLTLVTKGEEEVTEEKSEEIYAKGEEGQPHSIITLKLNHI